MVNSHTFAVQKYSRCYPKAEISSSSIAPSSAPPSASWEYVANKNIKLIVDEDEKSILVSAFIPKELILERLQLGGSTRPSLSMWAKTSTHSILGAYADKKFQIKLFDLQSFDSCVCILRRCHSVRMIDAKPIASDSAIRSMSASGSAATDSQPTGFSQEALSNQHPSFSQPALTSDPVPRVHQFSDQDRNSLCQLYLLACQLNTEQHIHVDLLTLEDDELRAFIELIMREEKLILED